MTCEIIQSQLTAFLDGELPAETLAEFAAHLQTCSECAGARDSQTALSALLSAWAIDAPDITLSVIQTVTADELALLRAEMRELRVEISQLREEIAAQRRPSPRSSKPPTWFPAPTPNYARMEENDPWNSAHFSRR